MEPVSVVINGIDYVPSTSTAVSATDPVKQKIVNTYKDIDIKDLKKVLSHEKKNLERLGERRVFTLDDDKKVVFNSSATFYTVSINDHTIDNDSVQNSEDIIENGKIFDSFDVYVNTNISKKNVYEPTIKSGGSRKKYRKYSRRIKSAKKSSRSRKFRNRK